MQQWIRYDEFRVMGELFVVKNLKQVFGDHVNPSIHPAETCEDAADLGRILTLR